MEERTANNITHTTADAANAAPAQSAAENAGAQEQQRCFTQADLDRIVAQRLARAQRDMEQQIAQARSEGRAEAERVAQMTEAERAAHDAEAAREREEQLAQREAELTRRELRAEAIDALIAKGLPRELEQLLNYADAAACTQSINALEKAFRSAVQKGVDERINQSVSSLPRTDGDTQAAMLLRMRAAAGL